MAFVVVVVAFGGYLYLNRPAPAPASNEVTTLQRGEYATVPNACRIVVGATLARYLPGSATSIQPIAEQAQSQCTYTVDAKPDFRVLNIMVQAYQPDLTVPFGNGNATTNASYNFAQQRQQLAHPPKHSAQPPATVAPLASLGDEAVAAEQVFHVGSVIDRVTVLARYRNVVVVVSFQAQESGGFGPVAVTELQAGAIQAAQEALAAVKAEPKVKG